MTLRPVHILPIVAAGAVVTSLWLTFAKPSPRFDDAKARASGFTSGAAVTDDIRFSSDPAPLASEADFAQLARMAKSPGPGPLPLAVASIGRARDEATRRRALAIVASLLEEPTLRSIAEGAFEKWARAGGVPLLRKLARDRDPNIAAAARSVLAFRDKSATESTGGRP